MHDGANRSFLQHRCNGRGLAGAAWFCLVSVAFVPEALSKDFTVDSALDAADVNPGDGICATASDLGSVCTVRAAIEETNALPGADTITVPAGLYVLSHASTAGPLRVVSSALTIYGSGADTTIIDGNEADRVFAINDSDVSICDVTIRNGKNVTETRRVLSSRISPVLEDSREGGGIRNVASRLRLNGVIVTSNSADRGGGIFNSASAELVVLQSAIIDNSATGVGGGIASFGTVTIQRSSISQNSAGAGGGLFNNGQLTITDSTIGGNSAMLVPGVSSGAGGGLIHHFGVASITNTTIAANVAAGSGGVKNRGVLSLVNSTLSGNKALAPCAYVTSFAQSNEPIGLEVVPACGVGAIFNRMGATATLSNVTVTENIVNVRTSGGASVFNGAVVNGGMFSIRNSIIAANSPENCGTVVTSQGHNPEDTATCGFFAAGDLTNTDPMLAPLADNGGSTETHALPAGSPAINAALACPVTDQRGFLRSTPQCDAGAYEKALFADLAVHKTVSCETVKQGSVVTFRVAMFNFGPTEARDVALLDVAGAGLSVTSVRASQGSCDTAERADGGVDVLCDVGAMPADGSAEVIVEAVANETGNLVNAAFISSPQAEDNILNNSSTIRMTVVGTER